MTAHDARRERFATAACIAALLACVVVFLWRPIARFSDVHFSPADVSRAFDVTRVGDAPPSNQLLSDPALQMEPWVLFARDELHAGRIPLWNPWNAGGQPLLANGQSALLSPFTLPFYVLDAKTALLVAAFAKLAASAIGAWLLARRLGASRVTALAAGVAYGFGGHQVLLLDYPHSAVAAWLPWCLFAVRVTLDAWEREGRANVVVRRRLALVAATLAGAAFSGHPETFAFDALLTGAYAAFELVHRRATLAWKHAATGLALAAGLALVVAAVQIVPLAEYVANSAAWTARAARPPLDARNWPLLFFPDLAGNPSTSYDLGESIPPPNYESAVAVHPGSIALVLGLAALVLARGRRERIFLGAVLGAWTLAAYDVLGAGRLLAHVPLVGLAPLDRSQHVAQLCLAVLAALALEGLVRRSRDDSGGGAGTRTRRRTALGLALFSAVLLAIWVAGAIAALRFLERYLRSFDWSARVQQFGPPHVRFISILFGAGIAAACCVPLVRERGRRNALVMLAVVAMFAQTGWLWRGYDPVCDDASFHPRTAAVETLQRELGDRRLLGVRSVALPPNENAVHRIRVAAGYDALGVQAYDALFRRAFSAHDNWSTATRADERSLELFGIDGVLDATPWLPLDAAFTPVASSGPDESATAPVVAGRGVVQRFTSLHDGLAAVVVELVPRDAHVATRFSLALDDAESGTRLASADLDASELRPDPDRRLRATLRCASRDVRRGQQLRFSVTSSETHEDAAIRLRVRRDAARWVNAALWRTELAGDPPRDGTPHPDLTAWTLEQAGARVGGGLVLEPTSDDRFGGSTAGERSLETRLALGGATLATSRGASSRFHCVSRVLFARDEDAAAVLVASRDFEPTRDVVLVDARAPAASGPVEPASLSSVRVASETPTRVELDVDGDRAGWLVTTDAWFPGWRATVDGRPSDVLRANVAFRAVAIGAGHQRVVLEYAPASFRVGALLSVLGLVALCAACVGRARADARLV